MVDVESLSDAEVRTKLMEYGYPVMPITGTTRKLMVKKLKMLMESKNKVNDSRRSLGRYSSEEESDTDVRSTRKDKNRRATMAAPSLQPPSSKATATLRKSLRRNDSDDINEAAAASIIKDVSKTTKRTTTTKVIKTVQDEFDTGSDSEPEIIENDFNSTPPARNSYEYKKESPIRSTFSPSSPFQFKQSVKYSPPKSVSSSSNISSSFTSSFANKPASPSRFTTNYSSNAGDNDDALDRLNQIRSRLSLGTTVFERPAYSTPIDNAEEKVETPFLSNFTRRLSQLSSSPPKPDYDYKNDIIKEHDTNGAGGYTRSYLGRSTRYRDINRDYYARHDSNIFKNNMVSFGVLGVAILFFLAVGVMYYGMRNNESSIDVAGKKFN